MRRTRTLLASLVATVALTGHPAVAQNVVDGFRIAAVDVDAHPTVRVEVALPGDLDGVDLTGAFGVAENGSSREIVRVRQASTGDLQVALVIDTSGSMGEQGMSESRAAAAAFLDGLPASAQAAVIGYDTEVDLLTGFGATREQHKAALDGLVADGETALLDAVLVALDAFPARSQDTEQTIVLLSDGADTVSEGTLDEVLAALAPTEVTVRGIAYQTAEADDTALLALADASAGSVVAADDPEALTAVYRALAAELDNRFLIDYRSQSSGPVELRVDVTRDGETSTSVQAIRLPSLPVPSPTEETTAPVPVAGTVLAQPSISSRQMLYGGAALWFVALATVLLLVFRPRERRTPLWGAAKRTHTANGSEWAHRATMLADRSLERHGRRSRLNVALERAGIDLRPGEYVVLSLCAMITAFAVGVVLGGWVAAILLAASAVVGARSYVSIRITRRRARFADQLGDTLQLLAGSLRAGYSFMQAIDAVAREADQPSAGEFSRMVVETRLGRGVDDALQAMSERMQSEDFDWVVQAIEIHREVGGDLAEVLDTVAGTIRERAQVRRQVEALSAEGRLSAWVLAALPFGVGTTIFFTNRPYLAELTHGGAVGWGLLAVGALLMAVGGLWLRALVRIEF